MENKPSQEEKKKGFFAKLFEKLDKTLEDKAKKTGCCCSPNTAPLPKSGNGGSPDCRPLKDNESQGSPSKDRKDSDGDSCCW